MAYTYYLPRHKHSTETISGSNIAHTSLRRFYLGNSRVECPALQANYQVVEKMRPPVDVGRLFCRR